MLGIDQTSWSELFGGSLPSYVHIQPTNPRDTDISTQDTISLMNSHAYQDVNHPVIQEAVEEIKESVGDEEDERELIRATFDYVQDKVTFVEDEEILRKLFNIDGNVELLITPARLLSMNRPMGDCDDFSTLVKCLLLGVGVHSEFMTVGADRLIPKKWSHVYNMTFLSDGSTIPVDSSHGKYVGWEVPEVSRKGVWVRNPQAKTLNKGKRRREIANNMSAHVDNGMGADDSVTVLDFPGMPTGMVDTKPSWESWLPGLIQTGEKIAVAQFGQPQLAPNTYIRDAKGAIMTNQPVGGAGLTSFSASGGFSTTTLIVGAVVVGALLLAFKK